MGQLKYEKFYRVLFFLLIIAGQKAVALTKTEEKTAMILESNLVNIARNIKARPATAAIARKSADRMIQGLEQLGKTSKEPSIQKKAEWWKAEIKKVAPLSKEEKTDEETQEPAVDEQEKQKDLEEKIEKKKAELTALMKEIELHKGNFKKNALKNIDELGEYENRAVAIIASWFNLIPEFDAAGFGELSDRIKAAYKDALQKHGVANQNALKAWWGTVIDTSQYETRFNNRLDEIIAVKKQKYEPQQEQLQEQSQVQQQLVQQEQAPKQQQEKHTEEQRQEQLHKQTQELEKKDEKRPQVQEQKQQQQQGQGQKQNQNQPQGQQQQVQSQEHGEEQPEEQPEEQDVKPLLVDHIDLLRTDKASWDNENENISQSWIRTLKSFCNAECLLQNRVLIEQLMRASFTGMQENLIEFSIEGQEDSLIDSIFTATFP